MAIAQLSTNNLTTQIYSKKLVNCLLVLVLVVVRLNSAHLELLIGRPERNKSSFLLAVIAKMLLSC